ncbi:MAG: low molecular weight phosphotyrosine protein phosphatase [Casimicrobiaceae bacterium]|nr:low molecular weight phosphotyrosine protein phosphatase [Casimicrobiaceae bacterium]
MNILFVCMGNICRSPTAEAVFRAKVEASPWKEQITIDSAGTHAAVYGHVGQPPDPRAVRHARARGYDLLKIRARAIEASDFEHFDLLLAMDDFNRRTLLAAAPRERHDRIRLLLEFAGDERICRLREVPDPYYGAGADFEHALDLIESASDGLLMWVGQRLGGPST